MSAPRARPVRGGKAVYGAAVGILMLDARFPRIPGDVGNAATWPFPVLYRVVRDASPDRVVRRAAEGLLEPFLEAAAGLVRDGADGLVTNCGFLSIFQQEIAAHAGVPVATSALMQLPLIERLLPPGRRVGILTISQETLSPAHLEAAGVALDAPVAGTDGGAEFTRVILNDALELDPAAAEADVLDAGRSLTRNHPEVGAILLECTNMCPYAAALRRETGLPVFDMTGFVHWFQAGLEPRAYGR